MKSDTIITVASWEDRFLLGFEEIIINNKPNNILLYYMDEYKEWTEKKRKQAEKLCKERNIKLDVETLSFENSVDSWKKLHATLVENDLSGGNVLIDISTMPRDIIWSVLYLLDDRTETLEYVYYQPKSYNDDWLSRDPGKPRFVYKLAGEIKLGLDTILLILTGYDVERVRQLIAFYEPALTILGLQAGEQFGNTSLNIDKYKEEFNDDQSVKTFEIDAYSEDHGLEAIITFLKPYINDNNILLSSLGPKPSAVALYQFHKLHTQTSLVYAPSREFNEKYSSGIGRKISGQIS